MPPEVVGEVLWPPHSLPGATDAEIVVIEGEDAAWSLAARRAEGADVDGLCPTMDGVRPAVARAGRHLPGGDDLHQLRLTGIGLGVEDVDARGAQAWHEQVAAFAVRVVLAMTQAGATCIPAEVVQLIARVGHVYAANDLPIRGGAGVDVHYTQCVGPAGVLSVQGYDVCQLFARRIHRQPRRWVEGRISVRLRHRSASPFRCRDSWPSASVALLPSWRAAYYLG